MSNNTSYSTRLSGSLISLALLIAAAYLLQDLLILLSFALVLALLLLPASKWMESKGLPRALAIFVAIVLTFALISSLLFVAGLQIMEFSSELPLFAKKTEKWVSSLQSFISSNFNISRRKQMLELSNELMALLKNSGVIISTTFSTALHVITALILVPVFTFFFLFYRDFFEQFLQKVFPKTEGQVLTKVMEKTGSVVQGYLVGLLVVMLIVGVLNSIGFWWIGVEYPVFFGFLTGVLLLIPYIGIWMGALLPILLSLITLSPSHALAVVAWVAAAQFIEANFITPLVVGSKVSMNPMVAMLALLCGELLWGIPGLILALPLTAVMKVIFDSIPSLEPYGFLLGEAPERTKETKVP
ncbi:MAG: AI-2E family transporter [Aquirufa sp.]|jgi:predicted PurR-regulated permease PerM